MFSTIFVALFACASAQWFHGPMMRSPLYAPRPILRHPFYAPAMHHPLIHPTYDSTLFEGKRIVVADAADGCASGFKYELPTELRDVAREREVRRDERITNPILPIVRPFLRPFLAPWWKKDDPIVEPMEMDRLDELELDLDAAVPDDDVELEDDDLEEAGFGGRAAADCVPDFREYIQRPLPEAALPEAPKPEALKPEATALNPWATNMGMWGGMMLNPYMGFPYRYNMGAIGLPWAPAAPVPRAAPILSDALLHRSIVAPLTPLHPFWAPMPYIKKK